MKISVVGAGQVGAATALNIIEEELADDVLVVDVVEGLPQGKCLDMLQSTPIKGVDANVKGSNNFADMADSDIVIITAGLPRKPGMTRMDLLKSNIGIVKPVTENVVRYAPQSKIIVVTNPLDIMTYVALKVSRFEPNRVVGMAGALDTTRFRMFIAKELGVSVEDVITMVLGGHGDSMVPLPRFTNVSGIPALDLMSKEKMDAIVDRTRKAGGEIVALLKMGSAYYAPGAAITQMVESIVRNKKRVLPACAQLQGQYGFNDVCVGVPTILGRNGVEKVIELKLTEDERAQLNESVGELVTTIAELKQNRLI